MAQEGYNPALAEAAALAAEAMQLEPTGVDELFEPITWSREPLIQYPSINGHNNQATFDKLVEYPNALKAGATVFTDLAQETNFPSSRIAIEQFETPNDIPEHIVSAAQKMGIRPEVIKGREITDAGELGWLISFDAETVHGDRYTFNAKMRVEEDFEDGNRRLWQGRIFIFPTSVSKNGEPVKLLDKIQELGYEVLVRKNPTHSNSESMNVTADSVCVSMYTNGQHSTQGNHDLACDCQGQLLQRQAYIHKHGGVSWMGLWEEGRGNGHEAHTAQFHAQNAAQKLGQPLPESYDVVTSAGFARDLRTPYLYFYPLMTIGIFGAKEKVVLPTNNGEKVAPYEEFGLEVKRLPVIDPSNPLYYALKNVNTGAKRRAGHMYPDELVPLVEEDVEPEPEHNKKARERAIIKINEAQGQGNLRLALAWDRDDTLEWTALIHADALRKGLVTLYGYDIADLPTDEQVMLLGSTDKAFGHFPEYEHLVKANRISEKFNTNIPLVDNRIPDILDEAEDNGFLTALCLTATPVHLGNVVETGLHTHLRGRDVPVIAKPDHIKLTDTSEWKIRELEKIEEACPETQIVIIDDSKGLAKAIQKYKQSHPETRIQCITLTGTLTQQAEENTISSDWDHMLETMNNIAPAA